MKRTRRQRRPPDDRPRETLQEWLQRGNTVTRCPPRPHADHGPTVQVDHSTYRQAIFLT